MKKPVAVWMRKTRTRRKRGGPHEEQVLFGGDGMIVLLGMPVYRCIGWRVGK
jgi:hypothetical protein